MIQIDMQMPERCGDCFAMRTDEIGLESWCSIEETKRDVYREEIKTKRPDWCPLKEQEAVEQKTGRWIYKKYDDMFMCSSCRKYSIRNDYPYCHWCGAKMEQKDGDGERRGDSG